MDHLISAVPKIITELLQAHKNTYLAGGFFSRVGRYNRTKKSMTYLIKNEDSDEMEIAGDYASGDCDIFTTVNNVVSISKFLQDRGYKCCRFEIRCDCDPNPHYAGGGMDTPIRMIFVPSDKHDNVVDLIVCNTDPLDMIKNFDFTCCKVWYDGTFLRGENLDEFFHRKTVVDLSSCKDISIFRYRLHNYRSRGFEVEIRCSDSDFSSVKPKMEHILKTKDQLRDYITGNLKEFMDMFPREHTCDMFKM